MTPDVEVKWPADENLLIGKKLVGLQLKKVQFQDNGKRPKEFGRLTWKFHNPKGQFDLVKKFPEIFYCLPTFVNRDLRKQAIHHSLFWRPKLCDKRDLNAWYNNNSSQTKTPHNSIYQAPRWGLFIEQLIGCSVGKKIDSIQEMKTYMKDVQSNMREVKSEDHDIKSKNAKIHENSLNIEHPVFFMALPYTSNPS